MELTCLGYAHLKHVLRNLFMTSIDFYFMIQTYLYKFLRIFRRLHDLITTYIMLLTCTLKKGKWTSEEANNKD